MSCHWYSKLASNLKFESPSQVSSLLRSVKALRLRHPSTRLGVVLIIQPKNLAAGLLFMTHPAATLDAYAPFTPACRSFRAIMFCPLFEGGGRSSSLTTKRTAIKNDNLFPKLDFSRNRISLRKVGDPKSLLSHDVSFIHS